MEGATIRQKRSSLKVNALSSDSLKEDYPKVLRDAYSDVSNF